MRHRLAGRKLSRDNEHRLAMKRNMAASLFEHERISTTLEKAKEVKGFAEKLITLGKKGDLAARRRVISLLGNNRNIVADEDGQPVKKGTVVGKLFSEIAPRYLDRSGGYTRIIKLAMNRLGDNGQVVLLQLVGEDEGGSDKETKSLNKRSRRAQAFSQMTASAGKSKAKKAKKEEQAEVAAEEVQEDKAQDEGAQDQANVQEQKENKEEDKS